MSHHEYLYCRTLTKFIPPTCCAAFVSVLTIAVSYGLATSGPTAVFLIETIGIAYGAVFSLLVTLVPKLLHAKEVLDDLASAAPVTASSFSTSGAANRRSGIVASSASSLDALAAQRGSRPEAATATGSSSASSPPPLARTRSMRSSISSYQRPSFLQNLEMVSVQSVSPSIADVPETNENVNAPPSTSLVGNGPTALPDAIPIAEAAEIEIYVQESASDSLAAQTIASSVAEVPSDVSTAVPALADTLATHSVTSSPPSSAEYARTYGANVNTAPAPPAERDTDDVHWHEMQHALELMHQKVAKLERLLQLKDAKIDALQASVPRQLERARSQMVNSVDVGVR